MKILAVVAYTGSKKLVRMTEAMLREFASQLDGLPPTRIVAVNNAASEPIPNGLVQWHATNETNEGFGPAINLAILREVFDSVKAGVPADFTHVLVLNNDLQFPHADWLPQLIKEDDGKHVLAPGTDNTATKAAVASGPEDKAPTLHREVSAYCWLLPISVVHAMRKRFGLILFHPNFPNYGSDDVAAACFRSFLGPTPFKIVHRSWVRHLKAQTAVETGAKAGDPVILRAIANFKHARRLT